MSEYINRDDLLNVINTNVAEKHNERCSQLLEAILNAPTENVAKVKHGEWKASVMSTGAPHCSLCNGVAPSRYTYCPHCGAKMDGKLKKRI